MRLLARHRTVPIFAEGKSRGVRGKAEIAGIAAGWRGSERKTACRLAAALLLAAAVAAAEPVSAHGHGGGRGGGHHGGHGFRGGFFFGGAVLGFPYNYGYGFLYTDPYAYEYPYPVPPAMSGPPVSYFCPASNTYYPYVGTCVVPWQAVPAQAQ